MCPPKFAADRIAKKFIPKSKDIEDSESQSEEESEEETVKPDIKYNPSKIRPSAIPKIKYADESESNSEEESKDDGYSHDEEGFDSEYSDLPDLFAQDIEKLEDEIDQMENEDGDLISSLRQQQETDKIVAHGTAQLQKQYEHLLRLRLKMQSLLTAVNQLPPAQIDANDTSNVFEISNSDPEIAESYKSAVESISKVSEDMKSLKSLLKSSYKWDENEDNTSIMLSVISHWGQKVRLGAGNKHGSVINRPIEQQIVTALKDRPSLIQPSRHVMEKRIFGLEKTPEVLLANYSDDEFYQKLLRDLVAEKKPDAPSLRTEKPKKELLKSRQINYEVIPQLQNYMIPTMDPIPDYVDALFASLMK